MDDVMASDKNRLVTLLLCFFLGAFGGHRFYVGKIGTGIAMLVTFGGIGIWALIDLVMIILGKFKDKNNLPITNW
ncbi:MAG: TM2 domain-containing protein [Nitrospirae bacterium]|nr:TM2 domain-containing protein [Nitrospirota bacterium]